MSTDTMTSITEHLEFLGYGCEAQDDGWTLAVHPTRPDFFARVTGLSRTDAGRGNLALVAEGVATLVGRGVYRLASGVGALSANTNA